MLEAYAYTQLGEDVECEASMRSAQSACSKADPILVADLATRRGIILDEPPAAERDYQIALNIVRQQHDSFREAGALVNLAEAALNQEHYDQSIDWAEASIRISKKLGYRLLEEKAEGNLAWDYYKLGDLDRSLPLFQQAEQSARELGSGVDQIRWLHDIGLIHEQTDRLETAVGEYRHALTMAKQLQDKDLVTVSLRELAFLSIDTGRWKDAEQFAEEAIKSAAEEDNSPVQLQALFAKGLIAAHNGDVATSEKLLSQVAGDPRHDRRSTRWSAQSALADIYAADHKAREADAEYRLAIDTVKQGRCDVHKEELRLPFFANATRVYDSYIGFLVQQGKSLEALKIADESRALTLAEGLGLEGKNCLASEAVFYPKKLAHDAGATILFYWLGVERSYLWLVTPQQVKLFPLPPSAAIEPMIKDYRTALVGSRDPLESGDKNGQQLYQILVAPAASLTPANGRVIVITDGSLSGLGFDSLIVPDPKPHYWIDDVTLENASSLRLLAARSAKQVASERKLLLMGNATASGDPAFPPLRHASEEMQGVGGHFPSANQQGYSGNRATIENYLSAHPEDFSYIHFVAHGTASVTDPLDSAVVLSPASQGGNYKLYARDVIAHPLKAQLVTISACKGAGTGLVGEGLVGLSWAFLHAGAHNVVGALWDVSDESTPQLMDAMYGELAKGSSPDAALRAAKLSLLHSAGVFHKPVYWAAFQLYTGS
jgi:CHAT domain-containing protein